MVPRAIAWAGACTLAAYLVGGRLQSLSGTIDLIIVGTAGLILATAAYPSPAGKQARPAGRSRLPRARSADGAVARAPEGGRWRRANPADDPPLNQSHRRRHHRRRAGHGLCLRLVRHAKRRGRTGAFRPARRGRLGRRARTCTRWTAGRPDQPGPGPGAAPTRSLRRLLGAAPRPRWPVVGRLAFCLTLLFRSSPRIWQHRPQLGESSQHLRVCWARPQWRATHFSATTRAAASERA